MKKLKLSFLTFALAFSILSGCTKPSSSYENFSAAHAVKETPTLVPEKMNAYQLSYDNNPAVMKAFHHYQQTGKAANIVTEGFIQVAYNSGQQPIISTSPFQQTVISLEPGEKWTNISSGDPSRWSYSVAYSGESGNQQAHVLLKPSYPDLSTNMVITTDRRIYNLKLVAMNDDHYVRDIRFWYPQDMINHQNNQNLQVFNSTVAVPHVNLSELNFNYQIDGGRHPPYWTPLRIFDDGKQTFIQFPLSIYSRDLPALFVMNDSSTPELVNYRYNPPYFVVDKLFAQAVLISGVDKHQCRVMITH